MFTYLKPYILHLLHHFHGRLLQLCRYFPFQQYSNVVLWSWPGVGVLSLYCHQAALFRLNTVQMESQNVLGVYFHSVNMVVWDHIITGCSKAYSDADCDFHKATGYHKIFDCADLEAVWKRFCWCLDLWEVIVHIKQARNKKNEIKQMCSKKFPLRPHLEPPPALSWRE